MKKFVALFTLIMFAITSMAQIVVYDSNSELSLAAAGVINAKNYVDANIDINGQTADSTEALVDASWSETMKVYFMTEDSVNYGDIILDNLTPTAYVTITDSLESATTLRMDWASAVIPTDSVQVGYFVYAEDSSFVSKITGVTDSSLTFYPAMSDTVDVADDITIFIYENLKDYEYTNGADDLPNYTWELEYPYVTAPPVLKPFTDKFVYAYAVPDSYTDTSVVDAGAFVKNYVNFYVYVDTGYYSGNYGLVTSKTDNALFLDWAVSMTGTPSYKVVRNYNDILKYEYLQKYIKLYLSSFANTQINYWRDVLGTKNIKEGSSYYGAPEYNVDKYNKMFEYGRIIHEATQTTTEPVEEPI